MSTSISELDKNGQNIADFIFYHNDTSGTNVYLHSFKIRAIVD